MDTQQTPSLSVLVEQAQAAAIVRACWPFQMAATFSHGADGTHIFVRHPEQPLSLCRNLTRPTRYMALKMLRLHRVTCLTCLTEFAARVAPHA